MYNLRGHLPDVKLPVELLRELRKEEYPDEYIGYLYIHLLGASYIHLPCAFTYDYVGRETAQGYPKSLQTLRFNRAIVCRGE